MANSIILKRTATSGRVFTTGELALGEVGINTYDGKLYIKKNDGTDAIVQVGELPPNYVLDNLNDVTTTNPYAPSDGYALVYNSALGQWIPSKVSSPGLNLVSSDITGALGFTPIQYSSLSITTAAASGGGSLSYNAGVFTFTPPNLSSYLTGITGTQVTTALGFTPLQANSLTVTTLPASGSGSLTYSYASAEFTFTPPKLSNFLTLSSLSGGTGVTYSSVTGVISIGQAVGTTSNVTFNDVTVSGNLDVKGTITTIESTTVTVTDKNLELGKVTTPTNSTADGGGITLKGTTDKTLNWVNSTSSWTSSENFDLASNKTYKIGGVDVVTSTGATSAAKLTTARNISSVSFDGTADITLNISNLGDVVVTDPTTGQILIYNGSKWVNSSGVTGYTGSQGIGYAGSIGFTGSASTVIGYTGSFGYAGSRGADGFVGRDGYTGSTGQGFTFLGDWNSSTTYVPYDVVVFNEETYVCRVTATGYQPYYTAFWSKIAAKGYAGSNGYSGSNGYAGSIGYTGSQGGFGGAAFDYVYSNDTSGSVDPATGQIEFDTATFGPSTTVLYISYLDSVGDSIYSFLQTIDDSTSQIKGHFSIAQKSDPTKYALFAIVGSHSEEGTPTHNHFHVPIAYLSGSVTSFANGTPLVITFARTGDRGDTGYVGSAGYAGSTGYVGSRGTDGVTPESLTYLPQTITLTDGVYVSGGLSDVQTFNDGNAYVITDGTHAGPAWVITLGFSGVVKFNRVVLNINYTVNSGHTIYIQVYNFNISTWDNVGFYSGLSGYSQFALEVLNSTNYVSGGTAQVRLYHSNTGNAAHQTQLDYVAIQDSIQGGQGPRGPTGYSGSIGYAGSTGYVGSRGVDGVIGRDGYSGSIGYAGSAGTNANLSTASINALGDVDTVTTPPLPGQALIWNSAQNNWVPGDVVTGGSTAISQIAKNVFTSSAGQTVFALSSMPPDSSSVNVFINSVYQTASSFAVAGSTVTLTAAPVTGSSVEIVAVFGATGTASGGSSVVSADVPPVSPKSGDLWFNTSVGQLFIYYNNYWVQPVTGDSGPTGYTGSQGFIGSKGESSFYSSATPPVSPVVGDRWFDTVLGKSVVWVYDGDSYQWVEPTSSGFLGATGYVGSAGYLGSTGYVGSTGQIGYTFSDNPPSSPNLGDRWLDSVTMSELIWNYDGDSYQWIEVAGTGFLGQLGYTGSVGAGYAGSRGESSFYYSTTPPVSPVVGDRWFDSVKGKIVVWTYDGDSYQWVEPASSGFLGATGYVGSVGYAGSVGLGVFNYSDTAPASPQPGDRWFDSVKGKQLEWIYDGDSYQWVEFAASGFLGATGYTGSASPGYTGSVGGKFNYSDTAPTSPQPGDCWFDSVKGKQVVWLNDGDSYQWVEFAASGYAGATGYTGSAGPAGGYTGSVGYVGSVGFVGSVGPSGGYTGSVGYVGSQGPAGGYTGSIGTAGYTGSIGNIGNPGYTGSVGYVGSAAPAAVVSDTAPSSPRPGTLWFNSSKLSTYVYYNDGTNSQWVNTNASSTLPNQTGQTGKVLSTDGASTYWTPASNLIGYTGSVSTVPGFTGSASFQIGYTGSASIIPGYTGSTGAGYTGSASTAIGFTGSTGPAGGYTGSLGYVGSVGIGYTGSAGVGYTGSSIAGYTSNALTIGTGLSGTSFNGSTPTTIAIDSTVATLSGAQTLTNKTITSLASASTLNDGGSSAYAIGFKAVPQSTTTAGNLTLTDAGKHVYINSGVTVPPNSTAAFDIGTVISIINSSSSTVTVTQGASVTLRLSGTTSTGNRTLAGYALCSVIKVGTDTWYISGSGVS